MYSTYLARLPLLPAVHRADHCCLTGISGLTTVARGSSRRRGPYSQPQLGFRVWVIVMVSLGSAQDYGGEHCVLAAGAWWWVAGPAECGL